VQPRTGLFEWGRSKAEAIVGRLVGLDGLRDLSALFADMVSIRERWPSLARRTHQLLRDPGTRYFVICAPTGGAMADAGYLVANLSRQGLRPSTVVLNRAESEPPACEQHVLEALERAATGVLPDNQHEALRTTLLRLREDHRLRGEAAQRAIDGLRRIAPAGTDVVRLPFVHRSEPRAIVLALADAWHDSGADI
jgi:hypothetical protein